MATLSRCTNADILKVRQVAWRRDAVGKGEDHGALLPFPGGTYVSAPVDEGHANICCHPTNDDMPGQAWFPLFCVITEKRSFTEKKDWGMKSHFFSQEKLEICMFKQKY